MSGQFPFCGADIEIFEACDGEPENGVLRPNRVRINGTEIITAANSEIIVEPLPLKHGVVIVTITKIICRSLTFRPEVHDAED